MQLQKLLEAITIEGTQGELNREISGIQIDSRQITAGQVFVAVRGSQNDGHKYIEKAIELGATAIVCEEFPTEINSNITYVKVRNSEHIVGNLATTFYDNPSKKFKLVGVTGTNGKTTIATTL
jgi:UDP-N-acetylmuramoyl-L-alanyl-D-glutamate--2,6-diaminopimelate ligase